MTALKPYLISAYDVGTEKDLEPWLIPEKAFVSMEDAYTWRGRILKKRGARQIGSASENLLPLTNPIGNYPASPPMTGTLTLPTGATLAPGSISFTNGTISISDVWTDGPVSHNGDGTLGPLANGYGTINYQTGAYSFVMTTSAGSPISASAEIYPNLPVMGIIPQETLPLIMRTASRLIRRTPSDLIRPRSSSKTSPMEPI